jgi:hypothetical protein
MLLMIGWQIASRKKEDVELIADQDNHSRGSNPDS